MTDSVDEGTRTPADRVRFYLRFVQWTWPNAPTTPAARWQHLHHRARLSNHVAQDLDRAGERDRFLEELVFELTRPLHSTVLTYTDRP